MNKQVDMFGIIVSINKEPDKSIPKGVKLKEGQLWCPYCSNIVKFVKDDHLGINKCPFCGISDSEYSVRMVNKLWK
ncbi:MAG: hypothetical protein RIN55_04700 [Tissierellaceae bacterium]|nr:hypothetical protein [Tissierellaceae bacterium]